MCAQDVLGPLRAALLAVLLSLTTVPARAQESTWAVGVAGGGTDGLIAATTHYDGHDFARRTDGTLFTAIHVLHDLGGHFSITGQANYLSFGDHAGAQYLPVGLGARYKFTTDASHKGSLYVELSPAIAWSRWRAAFFNDWEESHFRPALIAGLGVHGRLGGRIELDFGLRYFFTADGAERHYPGTTTSQTLEGVNQVGALVGLYYAL